MAERQDSTMERYRIGNGYDVHALREGLPMWLCGVRIESEAGFVAHSDGDVAIHALCDALLGAAALGDIGLHFPDSDDRWKGIDSMAGGTFNWTNLQTITSFTPISRRTS